MAIPLRKSINLALQGGGSHGAFTWGVLEVLLNEPRVSISAISGTSAGAMNAVALATGMTENGCKGALERLEGFWKAVSAHAALSPVQRTPVDAFFGNWSLEFSPGYRAFDQLTRTFSPYLLNPLNINPLRDLLLETVDFAAVRACGSPKLFISATNVETGRVKVFEGGELTADMVLASACLPTLFQAVEIDGVPYWDGGYMGNPALFPFFGGTDCADILIVQINPVERKGTPTSAHEIANRINEISFNASLLKELRAIEFVSRLIADGKLPASEYKDNHIHIIENGKALNPLDASSKMNAEWSFLSELRAIGQRTAAQWLDENFDAIGERSSVDVRALFQGIGPGY